MDIELVTIEATLDPVTPPLILEEPLDESDASPPRPGFWISTKVSVGPLRSY